MRKLTAEEMRLKQQEAASRNEGRAAVERENRIKALATKLKSMIPDSYGTHKTGLSASEYQTTLNTLKYELVNSGRSQREISEFLSNLYESASKGFAKHEESFDKFYSGMMDENASDFIEHYGILGMKWGIRRYQNPDGSLTELGRSRLAKREGRFERRKEKAITKGDVAFAYKHRDRFTESDFNRIKKIVDEKVKYSELSNKVAKMKADSLKRKLDMIVPVQQFTNNTLGTINNVLNLADRMNGGKGSDNFELRVFDEDGDLQMVTKKYNDHGTKRSDTWKYRK